MLHEALVPDPMGHSMSVFVQNPKHKKNVVGLTREVSMMHRELLPGSIKDKDANCVETNTPTLQNTQNSEYKQMLEGGNS